MITLYHHPLCPHSRFVRLLLAEYAVKPELIEEKAFERRRDFLILDPAGQTPVLVEESGTVVSGPGPIAEYFDETRGLALGRHRLLPEDSGSRAEVRRLFDCFSQKFFHEVTNWLVTERSISDSCPASRAAAGPTWISCMRRGSISAPTCAILVTWRATGIGSPETGCRMPTSPPRRISPARIFWATCHGKRTRWQSSGTP